MQSADELGLLLASGALCVLLSELLLPPLGQLAEGTLQAGIKAVKPVGCVT